MHLINVNVGGTLRNYLKREGNKEIFFSFQRLKLAAIRMKCYASFSSVAERVIFFLHLLHKFAKKIFREDIVPSSSELFDFDIYFSRSMK